MLSTTPYLHHNPPIKPDVPTTLWSAPATLGDSQIHHNQQSPPPQKKQYWPWRCQDLPKKTTEKKNKNKIKHVFVVKEPTVMIQKGSSRTVVSYALSESKNHGIS